MAEKQKQTPSSTIACPFCLDIFQDATLLKCGHTFCRDCLDKYDSSHQDLDHIVCPLCSKTTVLDETRVAGLPKNVTVSGMVEEYLTSGKLGSVDCGKPKCTACQTGGLAVSFCTSCRKHLCDRCHQGHQQFLNSFFKGHSVLIMKEITEQRLLIDHFSDECSKHKHDLKDLFCEDCKVCVCFKCTLVGHQGHKIRNRPDFEDDLQKRAQSLLDRCKVKQKELEENILKSESKRPDGHVAFQKLQADVEEAVRVKIKKLKENRDKLLNEADEMQTSFDSELDILKSLDRQILHRIRSYASEIDNEKLRHLERDSLAAHELICEELNALLETQNEVSGADILETAKYKRLLLAHDDVFDLGKFSDWNVITQLDLPHPIQGMAPNGPTSVVITQTKDINEVHSDGRHHDLNVPRIESYSYSDITLIGSNKYIISSGYYDTSTRYHVYFMGESETSAMNFPIPRGQVKISTGCLGEILIAIGAKQFWIYDPSKQKITHTVKTTDIIRQAFVTKSGLVVTSTCNSTDPSIVRVYDRDGKAGDQLKASKGECLYPAVGCNDRVFVATINRQSGKVLITLYDLEGLNLKERMHCDDPKQTLGDTWCYLVSLTYNVLAFACNKKLYFIKFPYSSVHRNLPEADSDSYV